MDLDKASGSWLEKSSEGDRAPVIILGCWRKNGKLINFEYYPMQGNSVFNFQSDVHKRKLCVSGPWVVEGQVLPYKSARVSRGNGNKREDFGNVPFMKA